MTAISTGKESVDNFLPIRMATIKKPGNKVWQGWGEVETLLHCGGNVKWYSQLYKAIWQFFKKIQTNI